MNLFSLFRNDAPTQQSRPAPESRQQATKPAEEEPLTEEERMRKFAEEEIREGRKREVEYLNRTLAKLDMQCRPPADNKYFIYYPAYEKPVYTTCKRQENPFFMGIDVFPLPARPNDRLNLKKHTEIKQGLMLKMPKRMIEDALADLGCVKEGQPYLKKGYEGQKYIAPNGTYFEFQDRGTLRMISFSVDGNRTNRILFDIFDELIARTDSPVAATLYLDTNKPGKEIYETPAVMLTANSWRRIHERTYPSYIDVQTAKVLYLYDDDVPTLAYDRAWKASHPEELVYWKNDDPKFYKEGAWRRVIGTRWAWEYEDADLQRKYLNRVMDVAEKYCTETTPDYLFNNTILSRKGPMIDKETMYRLRDYIASRDEEEQYLLHNGVEL